MDKKSNQKMAFLLIGQWISALFVVMISCIKKQKQANGKDTRGS